MKVCIISYGRAKNVITADWLKSAEIVVPKSQEEEYKEFNHNPIVTIPDELDGDSTRKKNAVLNLYPNEKVTILDDDIKYVGYYEYGKMIIAPEDHFLEFCEDMYLLAEELGTILWGVNVQSDKKFYREYSPFSLSSVVLAPWTNIINTDPSMRYDESLWLKEDYDFYLQVLNKYRRVLRNNKWFYVSKHITNSGGLVDKRTSEEEEKQILALQRKWGSRIVKVKRRTQGGNRTINPIVEAPIRGI